ncbi:MAG: hypothetical protein ABIJ41_00095 [Candidatus Omnitrophota bacterium]
MNQKQDCDEQGLIRRYLIWCYKTTKEDLDKIDRKFTQCAVDHFIIKEMEKAKKKIKKSTDINHYVRNLAQFKLYAANKQKKADQEKFIDQKKSLLNPSYVYLKTRLNAIEKCIQVFLGKKELLKVKSYYEQEMTRRILSAKERT